MQLKVAGGNIVLEAYFMTGIAGNIALRGAASVCCSCMWLASDWCWCYVGLAFFSAGLLILLQHCAAGFMGVPSALRSLPTDPPRLTFELGRVRRMLVPAMLLTVSWLLARMSLWFLSSFIQSSLERAFALIMQAVVAVAVRKLSLQMSQWLAIVCNCVVLGLLSLEAYLSYGSPSVDAPLAASTIVIALATSMPKPILQSAANYFEENEMKRQGATPLQVVFLEGLLVLVTLGFGLPILVHFYPTALSTLGSACVASVTTARNLVFVLSHILCFLVSSISQRNVIKLSSALEKEFWRTFIPLLSLFASFAIFLVGAVVAPSLSLGERPSWAALLVVPIVALSIASVRLFYVR
jgi:hypothetical protein